MKSARSLAGLFVLLVMLAVHTQSVTPPASAAVAGDVDCSGAMDSVDALRLLRHIVGLPVGQPEGCPDIGSEIAGQDLGFLTSAGLPAADGSQVQALGEEPPTSTVDQIHLSWLDDSATTMTVMWHTPSAANPAEVQYGPDTGYGSVAVGATSESTGEGYLHTVTLTDLTPGSAYHYRVSGDDGLWSMDHSFRTAPLDEGEFRFLAAADMGTPRDGDHLKSVAVSEALAARAPGAAFTVGGGDYWYAVGRGDEATVDQWFNQNEALMSEAPFMPAFGNHEKDTSERYFTRFALPTPENYYSFRYGGAHFLMIDTNVSYLPGSPQRSFIESDLKTAALDPTVNWIFAVFHDPPFAVGSVFPDLTARAELSPLLDKWGVDVVINGHAHRYERSFPVLADGTVTDLDPSQYTSPGAPIYLVTGGGGADPQFGCADAPWNAFCKNIQEFLEFEVTPTRVQVSAIGIDGVAFDGFTLKKGAKFGDIDCDGDVDSVDALLILRHIAGLAGDLLPVCPALQA